MSKQRLLDIFMTALMGAAIAFLQSFLVGMTDIGIPHADPMMASAAAAGIKSLPVFNRPVT